MTAISKDGDHYWDALKPGDTLRSTGVTVTETHLVTWAGLTGDFVALHLDKDYAATTQFGQRIAHGPFTLALSLGLMTQTGFFTHVIAWLGLDAVRATRPVLIGDTIRPIATVREARTTRREDAGLWTLDYAVTNQRAETVMTFTSSFLVEHRPESPAS